MSSDFKTELKNKVLDIVPRNNRVSFEVLCEELLQFKLCDHAGPHPITGREISPPIYECVLQLILVASRWEQTKEVMLGPLEEYWMQVEKAEKAIQQIVGQFHVARSAELVCYQPDELEKCPHEIDRFKCEILYAKKLNIILINQPPFSHTFPATVARVESKSPEVLGKELTEFCETRYRPPLERPQSITGRKKQAWKDDLVSGIVGILYAGVNLQIMEAVDFTSRIFSTVFEDDLSRYAIYKRWKRIEKEPPPDELFF